MAAVHGELFREVRPANTVMQVVRFIDPDWLVEIEADAVVELGAATFGLEPGGDASSLESRRGTSGSAPTPEHRPA